MGHGLYGDMVSAARYFDQAVPLFRSLAERRGLASSLISRAVWRSPLFTETTTSALGSLEACARDLTDNADAVWSGTRPTGPGIFALNSLEGEMVGLWQPWLLTSGDEVRPPPPPAPDSAQRAAEITEVRDYQRDANLFMELFFWPEDPDGRPEPGSAPVMSNAGRLLPRS